MSDITKTKRRDAWYKRYQGLTHAEYDRRLVDKLRECQRESLIGWLLEHAYDEITEEFNSEILDEWESEQCQ